MIASRISLIAVIVVTVSSQECIPSKGRGVGRIPEGCPDDHPDNDAGLCYVNCDPDYSGVGPVCFEECDGIDVGALCEIQSLETRAKDTYDRGVGSIPTDCGNKENDAGLCYDYCQSGYYGIGPVCWQHCQSGYEDHGASCYKSIIDFYFKDTYGRNVGSIPNACAPGQENDAGLCYPQCSSGYDGVATVCYEQCQSNEEDDGLFCRIPLITVPKDSYGRGVGVVPNVCDSGEDNDAGLCYPDCGDDDVWDGVGPVCFNKNFDTTFAVVASAAALAIPLASTCSLDIQYNAIVNAGSFTELFSTDFEDLCLLDNLIAEIDDSWDLKETAVGIEIGISAGNSFGGILGYISNYDNFPDFDSAPDFAQYVKENNSEDFTDEQLADFLYDLLIFWYENFFKNRDSINIYFGVAFHVNDDGNMDVYWYYGTCNTVVLDLISSGVAFTTLVHRSVDDIAGQGTYFNLGGSTPFVEAGVGVSYSIDSNCEAVSVGAYTSFGAGIIPFVQIEGGQCFTPKVSRIEMN